MGNDACGEGKPVKHVYQDVICDFHSVRKIQIDEKKGDRDPEKNGAGHDERSAPAAFVFRSV